MMLLMKMQQDPHLEAKACTWQQAVAPSLANHFMGRCEENLLDNYTLTLLWLRCIDGIFSLFGYMGKMKWMDVWNKQIVYTSQQCTPPLFTENSQALLEVVHWSNCRYNDCKSSLWIWNETDIYQQINFNV